MSLALVHSRARAGVRAPAVRVEVHLGGGLPSMSIVGLPEAAVRESKDRVRAAIQCAQFEFPARRITVNLAPADLPKDGGRFDLPIALGILAASGQVPLDAVQEYEFLGELGLTGELRAVDGVLPAALAAGQAGRRLIVPPGNGASPRRFTHAVAMPCAFAGTMSWKLLCAACNQRASPMRLRASFQCPGAGLYECTCCAVTIGSKSTVKRRRVAARRSSSTLERMPRR